jgi:hypothetical protein
MAHLAFSWASFARCECDGIFSARRRSSVEILGETVHLVMQQMIGERLTARIAGDFVTAMQCQCRRFRQRIASGTGNPRQPAGAQSVRVDVELIDGPVEAFGNRTLAHEPII